MHFFRRRLLLLSFGKPTLLNFRNLSFDRRKNDVVQRRGPGLVVETGHAEVQQAIRESTLMIVRLRVKHEARGLLRVWNCILEI